MNLIPTDSINTNTKKLSLLIKFSSFSSYSYICTLSSWINYWYNSFYSTSSFVPLSGDFIFSPHIYMCVCQYILIHVCVYFIKIKISTFAYLRIYMRTWTYTLRSYMRITSCWIPSTSRHRGSHDAGFPVTSDLTHNSMVRELPGNGLRSSITNTRFTSNYTNLIVPWYTLTTCIWAWKIYLQSIATSWYAFKKHLVLIVFIFWNSFLRNY